MRSAIIAHAVMLGAGAKRVRLSDYLAGDLMTQHVPQKPNEIKKLLADFAKQHNARVK